MNDAYLAKQFWRLKSNPFSMVSLMLKAKYFRNCDILASQVNMNSSPVWKGIWNADQKIKQWIRVDGNQNLNWLGDSSNVFSVKSAYMRLKEKTGCSLCGYKR